jgi:hypothetical protein
MGASAHGTAVGAVGTRYNVTHKRRAELTDLFAQEALTIQPIC